MKKLITEPKQPTCAEKLAFEKEQSAYWCELSKEYSNENHELKLKLGSLKDRLVTLKNAQYAVHLPFKGIVH